MPLLMQPFIIKNTFVEFTKEDTGCTRKAVLRRSTSLPPCYKFSAEESFQQDPVPSKKERLDWASVVDDIDTCTDGSSTSTSCEEGEAFVPRLSDLVRSPDEPTRLPLNLHAKSWKPRSPCEDLAIMEFATVVSICLSLLRRTSALEWTVVRSLAGWSMVCVCDGVASLYFDQTIRKAQAAVTEATRQSDTVFLLGHDAACFSQTRDGFGFQATLALVDKGNVCWDFLSNKYCPRGDCCRWEHKLPVKTVAFGARERRCTDQ
jgi:hypothetical protein